MTMTTTQSENPEAADVRFRAVEFEHSRNAAEVLEQLRVTLLISTYQAGKLLTLGSHDGKLHFSFHQFDQVMGVAAGADCIAVGSRRQVDFLKPQPGLAASLTPAGTYDSCWLARSSTVTGGIQGHDLAWGHDELWVVNTLFSCLCTLDGEYNFVPRWRPPFVSQLIGQDRCHLNGMAMEHGWPRYVSALGESDEPAGWRTNKASGGVVIDVNSGDIMARGLSMPHSPRVHKGRLYVLNSGCGQLGTIDRQTGDYHVIAALPGYTRGLSFAGDYAFVGLSRIRETNIFGGLPIGEFHEDLRCGVAVVELSSGRTVATLQFHSGVEEIFAVEVLMGSRNAKLIGPTLGEAGDEEIWVVPPPTDHPHQITVRAAVGKELAARGENSPEAQIDSKTAARRGVTAHQNGDLAEALHFFRQAMQLAPPNAVLLNNLGNLYQDLDDVAAAIAAYRQAVELDPQCAAAHQNLGVLCAQQNQPQRALNHFEQAHEARPDPVNWLLGAKTLPVIYESVDQLNYWRSRVVSRVHDLAESGVTIDATQNTLPTSFYLAYQGGNDCQVMQDLARIYQGTECCEAAGDEHHSSPNKRLRVGFASAYFCNHTIGRLKLGMIRQLPRADFDVTVIALRSHHDSQSDRFRHAADRYVEVLRDPATAIRTIADLQLDVLIFADVGMDTLTQSLCYSRMAPIQAVWWGHPVTTGSPAIDYFISSDLAEPAEADSHYSEKLERLPNLGVFYERPEYHSAAPDKKSLGLDDQRHVYLCPQTLFKFHPQLDSVFGRILQADPDGDLVIIGGQTPAWTHALQMRWQSCIPNADRRIRCLPSLPREEFLKLLDVADVMLDTFPFCGGNTSYEALGLGTPVVTLPGDFLRGRLTHAMYRRMQTDVCVAANADEYVQLAVQLACDRDLNTNVRRQIRETASVLYENPDDVKAFADMLNRWHGRLTS